MSRDKSRKSYYQALYEAHLSAEVTPEGEKVHESAVKPNKAGEFVAKELDGTPVRFKAEPWVDFKKLH